MTEEMHRRWDIIIKGVTPFLTIFGILIGVWQFNLQQSAQWKRQYEDTKLQSERQKREKQFDIYRKLTGIVGKIASANNKFRKNNKFIKEIDDYNALYWGETFLFEDKDVVSAMKLFYSLIQAYLMGSAKEKDLKTGASELNTAIREALDKEKT